MKLLHRLNMLTKFQLTISFLKCFPLSVFVVFFSGLRLKKTKLKKPKLIHSFFFCLFVCFLTDLIVVVASIIVLSIGSNGQVFATSAIR